MRGLAVALFVLLFATGFTSCPRRAEPPVANASAECYRQYVASIDDTGVRWEADPEDPEAWDALAGPAWRELVRRTLGTERSRQACVDFIRALQARGVIRSKP